MQSKPKPSMSKLHAVMFLLVGFASGLFTATLMITGDTDPSHVAPLARLPKAVALGHVSLEAAKQQLARKAAQQMAQKPAADPKQHLPKQGAQQMAEEEPAADPVEEAVEEVQLAAAPAQLAAAPAAASLRQAPGASGGRLDGMKPYAFVFVTGCVGEYQEFQSAALEWSWDETRAEGTLTRVVSGCKTDEEKAEAARSPLQGDPRFEVFHAKGDMRYVPTTGKLYPYRSKPWSLVQWLDADLPPWTREQPPDVVIIMDPDFMLLRPLNVHPQFKNVRPGKMLASTFDMGGNFINDFPKFLDERIPEGMTVYKANEDFSSGPPWCMNVMDFRKIVPLWANYTDQLGIKRGEFLDEQYALLLAAVYFNVPMLPEGNLFSVSNPIAFREAWTKKDDPEQYQPFVMHYCIVHSYGGWYFHKSLVARKGWYSEKFDNAIPGILSCDAPPLQEPPPPPSKAQEPDRKKRQTAWFLWRLFPRLNAGALAFRKKVCPDFQGSPKRYVRTQTPIICDNGRKTSIFYVSEGSGPQATTWEGNGINGDSACLHQA